MIESSMYIGIGFLLAALSVLVVAPLIHGRAVRLTLRRMEASIPRSMAEVKADKDLLRAEFAMSTRRLETNVQQLRNKSASQLVQLGRKNDAINRLNIALGALRDRLSATEEELAAKADAVNEAEHALSEKESELAKQISDLTEQSTLTDAQKIEIIALRIQVEDLKLQLDAARTEFKTEEDRHDIERIELKTVTQKLMEERSKFESFHRRVAELVQHLMEQRSRDNTEKEKLQAAFDRANGERARLAYELAKIERLDKDELAEPSESIMWTNAAAGIVGQVVNGPNSVAGDDDRSIH